jgi:hypothetical protein
MCGKTKIRFGILFGIFWICTVSYSQVPAPFQPGQIIPRVVCKGDAGQSYALYIPSRGNRVPLPVIYMFDPHGEGQLPLVKYRRLAEKYGFILAGSNNSRNGNEWAVTKNIWWRLFEDTKARLKIDDKRIYTCGFSGGAKVAGFVALQDLEVKSVIAGGAGLPEGTPAGDIRFNFTGIAGEGDMNLTDMVALNEELDRGRSRHRLLIFEGKHEWSPPKIMDIAFAGLEFDDMRQGSISRDTALTERYVTESQNRVNVHLKTGELIKAWQECQVSISLLEGLTEKVDWFKKKALSLASNPVYKQQRKQQTEQLANESAVKAEYMRQFQQGGMDYWTHTIHDLQARAAMKNAGTGMNQRLLAYLSLAFYSISNQLLGGNRDPEARHFVDLYKLADPDNSEAWYLSAILYARQNQGGLAEKELLQAVKCGFTDKDRLMRQPEFKQSGGKIDLTRVGNAMRASN